MKETFGTNRESGFRKGLRAPLLGVLIGIVFSATLLYSSPSLANPPAPKASANDSEPDSRYKDNGDGTVTDFKTGLMWVSKDSYLHKNQWMTWHEARDYVRSLNEERYGGFDDWRMPGFEELRSLYEPDKVNSQQLGHEMQIHIDPVFEKNGSGLIWSSQENGHFNAYGVIFNNGRGFSQAKDSKNRKATRAVRNLNK